MRNDDKCQQEKVLLFQGFSASRLVSAFVVAYS